MPQEIGKRFREERERLGYSQKALASRILTTSKTIIGYEAGQPPKLTQLLYFAGIGADINYILTGDRSLVSMVGEDRPPYTPAEHLSCHVAGLTLAEDQAAVLRRMVDVFMASDPLRRARLQGYCDSLAEVVVEGLATSPTPAVSGVSWHDFSEGPTAEASVSGMGSVGGASGK